MCFGNLKSVVIKGVSHDNLSISSLNMRFLNSGEWMTCNKTLDCKSGNESFNIAFETSSMSKSFTDFGTDEKLSINSTSISFEHVKDDELVNFLLSKILFSPTRR